MVATRLTSPVKTGLDALPETFRDAVVAIGNFDGVHQGHQAVITAARAAAGHHQTRVIALTFEPHPRSFFAPDRPLFRLTPRNLKDAALLAAGADGVLVLPFDATMASLAAETFVNDILVDRLSIRHAVTGYDFHFGRKRAGTPDYLVRSGATNGFGVTIVTEFGDDEGVVSSSRIRNLLAEGRIEKANELLGWDWSVIETVRHGEKRGRMLGYPTVNLSLPANTGIKQGIYAVRLARDDGIVHDGVASYGRRPTFDDGAPLLETYVFEFSEEIYDEAVLVTLVAWLRPEQAFPTAEALVEQMNADAVAARAALARKPPGPMTSIVVARWSANSRTGEKGDAEPA